MCVMWRGGGMTKTCAIGLRGNKNSNNSNSVPIFILHTRSSATVENVAYRIFTNKYIISLKFQFSASSFTSRCYINLKFFSFWFNHARSTIFLRVLLTSSEKKSNGWISIIINNKKNNILVFIKRYPKIFSHKIWN